MTITEKVAYLKGLMEGLDLDKTTKEGKVIAAMADILDDLALTVADNCDQIDAIDEDLESLEEYVYDDLDFDDYDDDLFDDDDDEDEAEYEFECPNCHEVVFIDESVFDEGKEIECPNCGAKLEGFYEEEEEDD
jgi:DNA-directed RNA polymerase subunit RPC12/RpoP